ncbi:MAG: hypothetical protein DRP71_07445 [Verrucomicrobia bacterium]|nr:MAG: hypothetical protein DRP71_07445 [Verrucomicrobiota bacterium]
MKCLPFVPVGSIALALSFPIARAQDDAVSEPANPEAQTVSEMPVEGMGEEGGGIESDESLFLQADRNQDGWLSGVEAGLYRAYDADRDGEVTELEFLAGRARDRLSIEEGRIVPEDIERFRSYDSTLSGYLSGTDIAAAGAGYYDTDFDGRVTRGEYFSGRERDRREAAEREARLVEQRRREYDRRRAAGEAVEAPAWGEPLLPRKGFMIGWVMTVDGDPLPDFTIEVVAFDVGTESLVMRTDREPQMIGRFKAKDGYYEVRLPDGSFGFVASVILEGPDGPRKFPLKPEGFNEGHLDYVEIDRSNDGVVKNLIWEYSLEDLP